MGLTACRRWRHTASVAGLEAIDAEVESAIERVRVPSYVIDRHGIIRWINPAAEKLVGDVRGLQLTSVLAPEEKLRGREIFTRNRGATQARRPRDRRVRPGQARR
jgi:PAS domain S-box-containing protein